MPYQCSHCGEVHYDLPHLSFALPDPIDEIPQEERAERTFITSDLCVLDDEHFFIRGVIEIPIQGQDAPFGFGVWVSQREDHFMEYQEGFSDTEHNFGPWFGWLSNDITLFGATTLLLKTMAHFQGHGLRPRIVLELTEHPLAIMQREGITLDQAWAMVHETPPN